MAEIAFASAFVLFYELIITIVVYFAVEES